MKTISILNPAPVAPVLVAVPKSVKSNDVDASGNDENGGHELHPPMPHAVQHALSAKDDSPDKGSRVDSSRTSFIPSFALAKYSRKGMVHYLCSC
jgi:hypothetical protein